MAFPEGFIELLTGPEDEGKRLDRVLKAVLKDKGLSAIFAALRKGLIRVEGRRSSPEWRVAKGSRIYIHTSIFGQGLPERRSPETLDLAPLAGLIVLQTRDLLFLNKPWGMLSQGPQGIEGLVRSALTTKSEASLSFSPGPLHRLDRNTSGLITFPMNAEGARVFSSLLRERRLHKSYLALLDGEVEKEESWLDRLVRDSQARASRVGEKGAQASADMRPLLAARGKSLVLVSLHTGLTHQIRVQAASRGLPLCGDAKYGGSPFAGGYILHAFRLEFPEPPFDDLPSRVTAPLPASARSRLDAIFGSESVEAAISRVLGQSLEGREDGEKGRLHI
jgi:Pseudouridylate synthases, 23S RNA-specific